MLKKLSLRMRLTLMSALVLTAAAIVLAAVSVLGADHLFVQNLGQELGGYAGKIENGQPVGEGFEELGDGQPGTVYRLPGPSGDTSSDQPQASQDGIQFSESVSPGDSPDIMLSLTGARTQFNVWLLVGLALVVVAGAGATWCIAGRALRPVDELSDAIERISSKNLDERVPVGGQSDEIGRLARSFNAMMDKVGASFAQQRRFSANAAHELKTPLATMQVSLEVLELDEASLDARSKKTFDTIKANVGRMSVLLDDLFRLSSDEDIGQGEAISLEELIGEIVADLAPQIRQRELTVTAECSSFLRVQGNRGMIQRALFNLVENAVKYNVDQGSVTISATQQPEGVSIQVSDTGVGIPPGHIDSVFEPFYRVDRSRSRAAGGTGLGLSLVRDIVDAHGGTVAAESTPGEQTVFTVVLPQRGGGGLESYL